MAKKSPSNNITALGHGVEYMAGSKILFVEASELPGAQPTKTPLRQFTTGKVVHWGNDNNYPRRVLIQALQSPELLALIDFMVTVIYGEGLGYEIYDAAARKWVDHYDPEIEDWMEDNQVQDSFLKKVMDLVWFNHGFTEMILTKDRTNICQVGHQEACFCRFAIANPKTGINESVFINANWPAGAPGDDYTTEVPLINPKDIYKAENVANSGKYKFIYPTSYPFPGNLVYQLPGWHSLFASKWFDINRLIPILKHALMKFQMTIKYIIEVPEEFWEIQARDRNQTWATMTPTEKKILKKQVKKEMEDFITGAENAGKSIMTTFGWDKINKIKIPGLSIHVLDDKLKDGKYIMDSQETSGQFARALGIPLPLMGPLSSGSMGAGSGSDARIHWNMLNSRLKARKHQAVSDYNFIAEFNGWKDRYQGGFRFKVKDIMLDTLDVNHSTSNPSTSQPLPAAA
jgi:hypothetical protein